MQTQDTRRRAVAVVREVSEEVNLSADQSTFLAAARISLLKAIPSDLVWHIELDFDVPGATLFGLVDAEALAARFSSVISSQPWIGRSYRPGERSPPAVISVPPPIMDLTRWIFEASPAYAGLLKPRRSHSQTVITHDATSRRATGWAMVRLHGRYTAADTELAGALQPMLAVLEKAYAKQADAQKAHGDPAERDLTAPDAGGPPAVTDEAVVAAVERYRLTTRELEVVRLLCRGLTAHQMARVLRISEGTTRKHLQNIYAKLGVHDRLLVAARVRSLGLDRSATPRS